MKLTKAQQQALYRVWRHQKPDMTYLTFRRSAIPELYGAAVMVHVNGMWIGIEPDGHAHS